MTTIKKKHEKVCYSKSFLKEVILRVDFPNPLSILAKKIPPKLYKAALSNFPVPESQQVQSQEIQLSSTGISANNKEETHWSFYGNEREKTLAITPRAIVLSVRTYKTFEQMTGDFFKVFDILKHLEPELVLSRVGLRYINIIDLQEGNPLDWKGYVNADLLGMINFNKKHENLSRAFHVLEYNFENVNLKCQFGVANPDYPALVKRRQFVLDFDAHSVSVNDVDELSKIIMDSHDYVQEFFESSIGEEARKQMKQVKHEQKPK